MRIVRCNDFKIKRIFFFRLYLNLNRKSDRSLSQNSTTTYSTYLARLRNIDFATLETLEELFYFNKSQRDTRLRNFGKKIICKIENEA